MVDSTPASGHSHVQIPLSSMCFTAGQPHHLSLALMMGLASPVSESDLFHPILLLTKQKHYGDHTEVGALGPFA